MEIGSKPDAKTSLTPGAPGGSRTLNLRFRRPLLYPLSYGRTCIHFKSAVSFYQQFPPEKEPQETILG